MVHLAHPYGGLRGDKVSELAYVLNVGSLVGLEFLDFYLFWLVLSWILSLSLGLLIESHGIIVVWILVLNRWL